MKKLYKVERRFYVMAEDEVDAEIHTPNDTSLCTNDVEEVEDFVDNEWWDAVPFNSDDDRTCAQILKEM